MKRFGLLLVSLLLSFHLSGQVRLPRLISDGMVLQRNTEVKIWGWSSANEQIIVNFLDTNYSTKADNNGDWHINLKKMDAGGPYTMNINGKNSVTIENILIGDVWVCSGQSNMELDMQRVEPLYEKEIKECSNSNIRQFYVPQKYEFKYPCKDLIWSEWKEADPDNIMDFSAVAYFFAKEIYNKYKVPVGLINASLGGSPAQAWMSEGALKEFPEYFNEMQKFKNDSLVRSINQNNKLKSLNWKEGLSKKDEGYNNTETPWYNELLNTSDWNRIMAPGYWTNTELDSINGSIWFRITVDISDPAEGKQARLLLGRIIDADDVFVNGKHIGSTGYQYPPRRYEVPSGILKAGENTIVVRVICNSGTGGFVPDKPYELIIENKKFDLNGEWYYKIGAKMPPLEPENFIRYKSGGLFNAMIAPLIDYSFKGVIWYQGESNAEKAIEYRTLFPSLINDWRKQWNKGDFPFLYVQLPNYMEPKDVPSTGNWAMMREAQSMALSLPNTGMAVTIDIGEWNDIHPLNKKDVGYRLALVAKKIAYHDENVIYSGPTFKSMEVKGNKIIVSFSNIGSGIEIKGGNELKHFAIAGPDKKFEWAKAKIENNKIIVWNDNIKNPIAVRYAWADNPAGANLYNKEGLPARPFRTDDWDD